MRLIAIGGTVLFCAWWGTDLLSGSTARVTPSALAPAVSEDSPGRVRALIGQLDDRRFAVRQEADTALREMPTAVVPLLEAELKTKPSLEVTRRLESIIAELSRVPWRTDLSAAMAEARRTGKPLLVFSSEQHAGSGATLMSPAFADREVVSYLRERFVPVWHVRPLSKQATIVNSRIRRAQLNLQYVDDLLQPAENARSYFCTADGRVIHYLEGGIAADAFLNEVRHAREVARWIGEMPEAERFDAARKTFTDRDPRVVERVHPFDRALKETNVPRVPELIGQPVQPILDRLRATMVMMTLGC